jgi:hypothetical protein
MVSGQPLWTPDWRPTQGMIRWDRRTPPGPFSKTECRLESAVLWQDQSGAGTGGCQAADPVIVLPEQREALERLVRTHSTPQQLALRAHIIVRAADVNRTRPVRAALRR